MTMSFDVPVFSVVSGQVAHDIIFSSVGKVIGIVADAYVSHARGKTVNPDSYFLRFPNNDSNRIIALPAHIDDGENSALGIKWISSFPANITNGLPRASAALILNAADTGYPLACLEASVISAARTAASAVLGATAFNKGSKKMHSLGIVGTGLIGRYIVEFLLASGWEIAQLHVHDKNPAYARSFADRFTHRFASVDLHDDPDQLARASELIIFSTTASRPYFGSLDALTHCPLILHISLRDLSTDIILNSDNFVDDVDHCLKANTSLHLAEIETGSRSFVTGTLPDVLNGSVVSDRIKPLIFSPFGMGILDIALGAYVLRSARHQKRQVDVPNFFFDLARI